MRVSVCAIVLFLLGVGALSGAWYIEHILGQAPCDLCMLQRLMVYAILSISVLLLTIKPALFVRRCLFVLSALFSLAGALLAWRHLYLQSLPEELKPSCGPGWQYLIEHAPFMQVLESVIKGSGECAQVQGLFFGFSLPHWTLLLFFIMFLVSLWGLNENRH